MASRYEKFVIIEDPTGTGRFAFECIFCGRVWFPSVATGGRLYRGSYLCPGGCTEDYEEAYKRWKKTLFRKDPATGKFTPITTKKN